MNSRNPKILPFCLAGLAIFTVCRRGSAQATPFYYQETVAVDPQISVLAVGVNEQVQQAVVSSDRKHVHLDINTTSAIPLGLQTFTYQTGGLGFVGSAAAVKGVTPAANQSVVDGSSASQRNPLLPSIARSPSELLSSQPTELDKTGMTLIARLH
jgi:hypothetical protein